MDFDDTPEEATFRAEVRAWLDAHAELRDLSSPPSLKASHAEGHVERCREWQRTLYDGGWAGVTWPAEYGGRGGTPNEARIFNEEQARYDVSAGVFTVSIGMVGPTLIAHGTPEQQARHLDPILRGDEIWCQLFSEPEAGSDLAGLRTRAVRDGDDFVVNGQKVWTSGAQHSEWGILLVRTDADVPKHRGITYLLVDMASPGVEIRPLRQITGHAHFNEVFLSDVRVPVANVVGEIDQGWTPVLTTLANERTAIGGATTSLAGFDQVCRVLEPFGRLDDPRTRQDLARFYTRFRILEFLRYRVATALSQGTPPGAEASIMKLFLSLHAEASGDLLVGGEGPAGMLGDGDAPADELAQLQFLGQWSMRIGGGTDQIQRNIIGERVLGLPREPRLDKDVPFRELSSGTATAA